MIGHWCTDRDSRKLSQLSFKIEAKACTSAFVDEEKSPYDAYQTHVVRFQGQQGQLNHQFYDRCKATCDETSEKSVLFLSIGLQ